MSFSSFILILVLAGTAIGRVVNVRPLNGTRNIQHPDSSTSTVPSALSGASSRRDQPTTPSSISRCEQTLDLGICRGSHDEEDNQPIIRWFFDSQTGECLAFTYNGCGGDANANNRFDSRMECSISCIPMDGATCAMNQPTIVGEWIDASSTDRGCGNLQCPVGYRCKHGPMRSEASCCSKKTERSYTKAHTGRGLCPKSAVPMLRDDEILVGASCTTLQCPEGHACLSNRYFSNCCSTNVTAGDLAEQNTNNNNTTTDTILRLKRDDPPATPRWMRSGKFQGDIAGFNDQDDFNEWADRVNGFYGRGRRKPDEEISDSATSDPRRLWPDAVVPYHITSTSTKLREAVHAAIQDFKTHTCVRFVERTNEAAYLNIVDTEEGCFSFIGRQNPRKAQTLNLARGCWSKGTATHEMMHAIGFWHEHQRTDRDKYVQVHEDNIEASCYRSNYQIARMSQMNLIGSYDIGSVMHYPSTPFCSKNGRSTMTPKNGAAANSMGNNEGMTDEDKRKIRQLYGCSTTTTTTTTKSKCPSAITAHMTDSHGDQVSVCAVVYDQSKCNGRKQAIQADWMYEHLSEVNGQDWNDKIVSMEVNPRCSVTLCPDTHLNGDCGTFEGDANGKNIYDIGLLSNRVSSMHCTCH